MDYLYINAIVKEVYKDLPCGCPFPEEHSKTMYNTVSGFDCLSNPAVPDILSFFTVRAKGQPSALVFSRIQKHTNSASVGRFIQSIGWTWDGNLLFRNLDEVLNVGFYSEQEINDTALRGGSFALPKDRTSSYETVPVSFSPQVKQAILTTVLLRWMRFDAPLRIAVPKNVDYNSYVLSAMKAIYSLFPASLRARAGFCSYLPSYKDLPETVAIGFVPEEMADSRTLSLDGSSPAACNTLCCGTNSTPLDTFIEYISQAPASELQDFFEEIYEDLEGSGNHDEMIKVVPRDYQSIGSALALLAMDGPLPELKRAWDERFFKDVSKFSPRMQSRIRAKIRATADPAEFCTLAERRLAAEGFEGLKAYQEYCSGNPELTDALWDTALRLQTERGKTYAEIFNTVGKRKADLAFILNDSKLDSLFYLAAREQLQNLQSKAISDDTGEIAQQLDTLARLREKAAERIAVPGMAQLLDEVDRLTAELCGHRDELIYNSFHTRFAEIRERPAKTVEQLEGTIEKLKRLLEESKTGPQTDNFRQLQQAMADLITAKEEEINSSHGKFMKIDRILYNRSTTEYFTVLEELNKADKSQLEEQHHLIIATKLAELRARTLEQYIAAFSESYNKPLTLANMAALPTYVFARVAQDICQLKQLTLNCAQNCRAAETADRISGALAVAGKISDAHTLDVIYNGIRLKPDWFRNLLQLKLDKRTMGDSQQMTDIFYALVGEGAFQGNDLIGAAEMITRCDLPKKALFSAALRGSFAGATEDQYRQAFEIMVRGSGNASEMLEKMAAVEQKIHEKDSKAVKAFREVQRAQEQMPARTPSKGIFAIIGALGVLVIVLSVILIVTLLKKDDAPVAPTTPSIPAQTESSAEIAPTVPPVVYPEEILFHGDNAEAIAFLYGSNPAAFAGHSARVEAMLDTADSELSGVILDLYSQFRGTDVAIDAAGTTVRWEEYFFWMLRYHADTEAGELLSLLQQDASSEEVLSILQVIHHNLPQNEISPEQIPSEDNAPESGVPEDSANTAQGQIPTGPTPPDGSGIVEEPEDPAIRNTETQETEPAGTEAPETEPAGTEPPATVADVKAAAIAAAADSYEAALPYADHLLLVQKIFGAGFTKEFSSHADLVAGLDMIGDAQSPSYAHFLKHYQIMPGDSVIRFEETGINITWDEFVFWECWVLAQRGTTTVDEKTFDTALYGKVAEVLSVVYQLVGEEEYPAGLAIPEVGSAPYQSECEITPELMNMIQAAKTNFEEKQAVYCAIFTASQEP